MQVRREGEPHAKQGGLVYDWGAAEGEGGGRGGVEPGGAAGRGEEAEEGGRETAADEDAAEDARDVGISKKG